MEKPILVVMAAGMGSRYGGLKQIDPIGAHGEIIIDYSIYDAAKAGFQKVVFVIKKEHEHDFKEVIGNRISKYMEVQYVYQDIADVPSGFCVPNGRQKPWGTAHAVLSCRGQINEPFCVINADDYYGSQAFPLMYENLLGRRDTDRYQYSMVGYILENTLTENGHVARGICETKDGLLTSVTERTQIQMRGETPAYTEDGENWMPIPRGSIVSLNLWGFTPSMLKELETRFSVFLEKELQENPLKGEYFLPSVVNQLVDEGKADVRVLQSPDHWYGVTYREDKPIIMEAISRLVASGVYPQKLWE